MVTLVPALAVLIASSASPCPVTENAAAAAVHPLVWRLLEEDRDPLPVWVFFADKGLDPESERAAALAAAEMRLSPRALERRRLRRAVPGLVDERDVDLCPTYVEAVLDTGACHRTTSRWGNALSVEATPDQVRLIAALPFVRSVEPVRQGRFAGVVPIESARPAGPGGAAAGGYGFSEEQLAQIGIIDMHGAGYTGDGIVIGVLDTGFVKTHEAYNEPGHALDVIAEWDFINDDPDVGIEAGDPGSQHRHGTIVLGTIGGYRPGTYIGGAYDASFILAKTEDTADEQPVEEDYYVAGLEFIEANGGDVATSSLIYTAWYTWFDMDGLTAVTTIGVNAATDNGVACCTAAGNYGYDGDLPTIGAPADAFEVVTVGAVDDAGDMADFSSDGPTFDGRVKPEVVARGVSTASVDPDDDSGYLTASGTSLSTPLAASAVALLIEAHPDWTIPQIRTALFETADYFVANGEPDPAFRRGYGLIDVFAATQVDFCNADLDENGAVSTADLLELLGSWGPCPGCPADLDGDGNVSTSDLLILLGTWGPC